MYSQDASHNPAQPGAHPGHSSEPSFNIGVIDDDPRVLETVCRHLLSAGLRPLPCTQSPQIMELVQAKRLHLLLVDIGLGDENGIDLIRRVRTISTLPIIIISGYCESATVAQGLNAGADDYQRKPLAFDELTARIHSVLRRHPSPVPSENVVKGYRIGKVHVDFRTRTAKGAAGESDFTELEMQIIARLLQSPGKTLSRDALSRELFGPGWDPSTRALDVHMTRIRRKLSAAGAPEKLIMTRRNMGYELHPIVEITPLK
jgi:DNA-binding response OmpR family regulator